VIGSFAALLHCDLLPEALQKLCCCLLPACTAKQCCDPERRLPCAVQHLEGRAHNDAELVLDRDHVSDAADHGKDGELSEERAPLGVIGKDSLGDLEGEPAPRKLRERVCCVGAIRVDQPRRACRLWRDRVVIDDADEDPCVARLFNTRAISSAAIDCGDSREAIAFAMFSLIAVSLAYSSESSVSSTSRGSMRWGRACFIWVDWKSAQGRGCRRGRTASTPAGRDGDEGEMLKGGACTRALRSSKLSLHKHGI
jgi:hypothetical protein